MKLYPQFLLWTYVLLPAISLLLSPTFIVALARAQQQRAKIMMNALNARGRAAAAIARSHQRRYIPNNRYLNGFGPHRPFNFRTKRDLEMDAPDVMRSIIENPEAPDPFERDAHWDQQEESLGQLANMWNMNNFGSSQIGDVIRSMHEDDQPEIATEEKVGGPFIYNHQKNRNYDNSDYYSGAFFGRNVFDEVLEHGEPLSLIQNEDAPPNNDEILGNPEPTFKKKKSKKNQESHQQNHYNYYYYYPQNSHGSSYQPYGRSSIAEDMPLVEPIGTDGITGLSITDTPNSDETLGNPEPTFKKKKSKKMQEPHQQNYYNYYYPQNSHGNSYHPYGRSSIAGDMPLVEPFEIDDITGLSIGDTSNTDEILGNPEPTFKKKKSKKEQESHQQNHYNYYYYFPQNSHGNSYHPYYRSSTAENMPLVEPFEIDDITGLSIGGTSNVDEILGNADPKFKKKKSKKKQKFHHSHGRSHTAEHMPLDEPFEIDGITGLSIGDPLNTDERLGNPEPTFKKKKSKKESHQQNHYNYYYYYPQNSHGSSYHSYGRSSTAEGIAEPFEKDDITGLSIGDPSKFDERLGSPEPTYQQSKKEVSHEHEPYHNQPSYSSPYYPQYSHSNEYYPYSRNVEIEDISQNRPMPLDHSELVAPRFADPDPTIKKKKSKEIEHMPPSFYYPPAPSYPQDKYISYYPSDPYSDSNYDPYARNTDTEWLHRNKMKRSVVNNGKVGEENPFEEEQKSANPQPNHNHHMKIEKKNGGGNDFFYSSNFYERENEGEVNGNKNGVNISKQDVKSDLPAVLNEEQSAEKDQKVIEEPINLNVNSSQTSENVTAPLNDQDPRENPEEVGCELDEKIEEKLQKKLKKLLKKFDKKDKKDKKDEKDKKDDEPINYPYPPMYPPPHNYEDEYEPDYYRSAPGADQLHETIKNKDDNKNSPKHSIESIDKLVLDALPTKDLTTKLPAINEGTNILNEPADLPSTSISNQDLMPTNVFAENMDTLGSSLGGDHTHVHPEDVGCEQENELFTPSSSTHPFDPLSYYEKTVEGLSKESKKLTEEAKKIFHTPEHQPVKPVEHKIAKPKKITYEDMDEISNDGYEPNEQVHFDSLSPNSNEYSTSLEEKSANPNADPTHHSRDFTHTHSHFSSHTHSHAHGKNIESQHGAHNLHPATPIHHNSQVLPHHHELGFSQATAKAQTFNHGGVQHSVANANTFGNGFGSNVATAQSEAQSFNRPINGFTQTGPQTFPNNGFGQTAASAGSFIQNGPSFIPSSVINQPTFNHEEFGQSAAEASGQAGLIGFNGVQNFGNGFHNAQGIPFNNNPSQFGSSFANAQIVGRPRETFVRLMPNFEEIPMHNLMSDMNFDRPRFSRTSQDFQDAFRGLGLASSIVDASVNKNPFINENPEGKMNDETEDTGRTLDFVTNIVDSSLRVGEDITQHDKGVKVPAQSNSATQLTHRGISSITDLVNKGLRLKRAAIVEDSTDFQNNQHTILGDNVNTAELAQESKSNIVGNLTSHLISISKSDKVLRGQGKDALLQISKETNGNTGDDASENQDKDMVQVSVTISDSSDNSGMRNRVEEAGILGMNSPDSFTTIPEIITSESWTSKFNHKDDGIIYVTPVSSTGLESPETISVINPVTKTLNAEVYKVDKSYRGSDIPSQNTTNEPVKYVKDLPKDASQKNNYNDSMARNNYFLGLQHPKDSSIEKNSNPDQKITAGDKVSDEISDTEIPKEILTKYMLFPNGTRKNISELTSNEILELQFDLPNKSTYSPDPGHSNSTSDEPMLQLTLPNNINSDIEPKSNPHEFENKDLESTDTEISVNREPNSINTVQGDPSHIPEITPLSPHDKVQQDLIRKLMENMSDGPLASIEEEMSGLTEEEKEAFIKQEVNLIAQVIEETLKNINSEGTTFQNHNTTKDIRNGTKNETKAQSSIVASPNIFQAFSRENDREEYSRQAHDEPSKKEIFDDLLGQQRKKVENIKNTADDDNDLLMISFIGDSVIKDLKNRRDKNDDINLLSNREQNKTNPDNNLLNPINIVDESTKTALANQNNKQSEKSESAATKSKREIRGIRSSRAPLTQLITDPTTKLDVGKTLQNLGSIARHTFENPRAPMYHVRNMLGNAKNSVMSAAKVPPNNFLIPSQYEIAKISRDKNLNGENVGAVNRQMLLARSFGNAETTEKKEDTESAPNVGNGNSFGFEDTVQKIGGMVKESVQTGKDALMHVNDVAEDAKKVLHTSKYATPRLVRPLPRPTLTSRGAILPGISQLKYSPYKQEFNKKTMEPILGAYLPKKAPASTLNKNPILIAPKILDYQKNIVGATQDHPDNFLGMGHILDAAGFSQPDQPEVELQKIEFIPSTNTNFKTFKIPAKSITTSTSQPPTTDNLKKELNEKRGVLGATRSNDAASEDSLQDDEHTTVTESLQDFMQRMHNEMKEIVRLQYEERKRMRKERTKNSRRTNSYYNKTMKDYENYKKAARETGEYIGKSNPMSPPMLRKSYYNMRNSDNEKVEMTSPPEVMNMFSQKSQHVPNENLIQENNLYNPSIYSRIQINPTYEPLNQDTSLPVTNYAEKYSYQAQYEQSPKFSQNSNDDGMVGLLLPDNLMKPFMGQPSESLVEDYMRENGDEDVFERERSADSKKIAKLPEISIPKLQPLSPVNLNDLAPKPYNLQKLAVLPEQRSLTPLNLQLPKIESLLSPKLATITSRGEMVGSSVPENIVANASTNSEIEEKTKEFVELLSDPEIDDSEVSNQTVVQTTTSRYLDRIEPENSNIVENIKQKPASSKRNSLTVGHVPDENDLGYVLGAINPMMFEKHFNERLKINDTSSKDTHNKFLEHGVIKKSDDSNVDLGKLGETSTENLNLNEEFVEAIANLLKESNEQLEKNKDVEEPNVTNSDRRTSMTISGPFKKPFMGIAEEDTIHEFLDKYNKNLPQEHGVQQEEYTSHEIYKQENNDPVKNVIFSSSLDDEDDYGPYMD